MSHTSAPAVAALAATVAMLIGPVTATAQPAASDPAAAVVPRAPVRPPDHPWSFRREAPSDRLRDALAGHARGHRLIYVTDSDGVVRACGLVAREPEGLRVRVRSGEMLLPWEDIARVDAPGDPIHDGFLKGMLFGVGLGAFAALVGGGDVRADFIGRAALGYGLIGAAIDAAHEGTTTLFVAPSRTPGWRAGRTGQRPSPAIVFGGRLTF